MPKIFKYLLSILLVALCSASAFAQYTDANIRNAIAAASPGATITLEAGTYDLGSVVDINKAVTIKGVNNTSTIIHVSGTGYRFNVSAPNVTIQDVQIQKTDKTSGQDIIYVGASNFTLRNSIVSGQFVIGEEEVTRAMVMTGGLSGVLIEGNTFFALRQPAYVSGPTTGEVKNNFTYGTKGWVLEGGSLTFTGNTWGKGAQSNVYDIAIINLVPATEYTNIAAMSAANNEAVIEDQRVSPAVLSVVHVDAATAYESDLGGNYHPYKSLVPAVARVVSGGTIKVANGTYPLTATLNLNRSMTIVGESEAGVIIDATATPAGGWSINPNKSNTTLSNMTIIPNSTNGGYPIHVGDNMVPVVIENVTLSHMTIDGAYKAAFDFNGVTNLNVSYLTAKNSLHGNGIQFSGCTNVTASNLTTSGNAWGGVAVYVSKDVPNGVGRGSDQVTISSSSFGESTKIYSQDEVGYVNTNITSGFDFVIRNSSMTGFTFYQPDKASALSYAAALAPAENSSIKQISTNQWTVVPGLSVRAAVAAASANDVINVYPGTYNSGSYVVVDKAGLKIQGVDADGKQITSAENVLATVGPLTGGEADMVFHIVANDVTITGIRIADQNNKAMTINGDNFTLTNCRLENEWDLSGSIYFYDATPGIKSNENKSAQKKFTIRNNVIKGWGVAITDGTGCGWPASDRVIADNVFGKSTLFPGDTFYSIGFRSVNSSGWCNSPVGGATITGNTFLDLGTMGYVYFDGNEPAAGLNFADIIANNTFAYGVAMAFSPVGAARPVAASDPLNRASRPNLTILRNLISREIANAQAGDIVKVGPGTYTEALTIDKSLTLLGANADVNPNTGVRGAETIIDESSISSAGSGNVQLIQITSTGKVVINGFTFVDNDLTATGMRHLLYMPTTADHEIKFNRFVRAASATVTGDPRAITITPGASGKVTVEQNLFLGSSNADLFNNKGWKRGVWSDGGGVATTVTNNVFKYCRTALNLDSFTPSASITGNTFQENGTAISIGLLGAGTFTNITGNAFNNAPYSAVFNLSSVIDPTAVVDARSNSYDGKLSSAMTDAELFRLENRTIHRFNKGKSGLVLYKTNNVYIVPASADKRGSIQEGINAASSGWTIHVAPGKYDETAPNSSFNGGTYQFGLFFPASKSGVTVQGCKADGTPVTSVDDIAAFITTNATNTFGFSGTLIAANNVTLRGLEFGKNTPADDKAVEVVGDGLVFDACRITAEAPLYIGDYNYNENGTPADFSDDISSIQSYTISNSHFKVGDVYIANGAGWTGAAPASVSGRSITGCTFEGPALISFAGMTPNAGWLNYPTGAASITGNTFKNTDAGNTRYIQSWGQVQAQFPYASYWNDNTFPKKTITTSDGNPDHVVGYDAGDYLNLKRIGNTIQQRIANAQPGNVILAGAGTYEEDVTVDKSVTLKGAGRDVTTIKGPKTGAANTVTLSADNIVFDGFTVTRDGNTVADWATNAKSQGITISSSITGDIVQNCKVTGNRNGIYLNNTQGHTIKNNVITNNRTGMQFVNNVSNCLVENNEITNNWTLGIVVYYLSALPASENVVVRNNTITGNWYGCVNSKTGSANPTTSYNFEGNWYGTPALKVSADASVEPGYAAQIPAAFGGTAVNPGTYEGVINGDLSGLIDYSPWTGMPQPVTDAALNTPIAFDQAKSTLTFTSLPEGTNVVASVERKTAAPVDAPALPVLQGTAAPLYLEIKADGLTAGFAVTVVIDVSDVANFSPDTRVMYFNTTTGQWNLVGGAGLYNPTLHTYTFTTTHFTLFAFGVPDESLPVELAAFTAEVSPAAVHLLWKTATEVDNRGFDVERQEMTTGGVEGAWKKLGFVQGAGTANAPHEYAFSDRARNLNGTVRYRLKQIDNSGKFAYSTVVEVQAATPVTYALQQNYPNPFNPSTKIGFEMPKAGEVTLAVFNLIGEKVAEVVHAFYPAGRHEVSFNAAGLSSGMYIYRISVNGTTMSRKMMLMK